MVDVIKANTFDRVFVVIDEADQGGAEGTEARLKFLVQVETEARKSVVTSAVKVCFITATIANLSKVIFKIATMAKREYKGTLVEKLLDERPLVEQYYPEPSDNYVGPSWFEETDNVQFFRLPQRPMGMSDKEVKERYINLCRQVIGNTIEDDLDEEYKELTLAVMSTTQDAHTDEAVQFLNLGYNVTVCLDSRDGKNYEVMYRKGGREQKWNIPCRELFSRADEGKLSRFENDEGKSVQTGIDSSDDITLPHILQAAIFMQSRQHRYDIYRRVSEEEFIRLQALHAEINRISTPDSFPSNKSLRVAVIAGNIAGRGNTLQSAYTGFTYTSMIFTDVSDNPQRGAVNAQRFGRACGLLMDAYATKPPKVLLTKNIFNMAKANEKVVLKKAEAISQDEAEAMVSLKLFVSEMEWQDVSVNQ
jgi:hypothetical protein